MTKRALVISGGGSKGAFGGGVVEYLMMEKNRDYDLLIGTSTGNLLVPLISIKAFDKLYGGYTNVTQKDIFKINPFKVYKDKNGVVKVGINHWSVLYNILIRRKKSFGDSSNLRKYIKKILSERDFKQIKESEKEVISCVTNLTLAQSEFKSSKDYGYKDYTEWMWASCSVPPFMNIVRKDGYEYADGSLAEHAVLQHAIDCGATDIDVIVLRKDVKQLNVEKIRNPFHYIVRSSDIMWLTIESSELSLNNLKNYGNNINLNFYFTPERLTNNSLIFNSEVMRGWWALGKKSAEDNYYKSYQLVGRRKPKLVFDGTVSNNINR